MSKKTPGYVAFEKEQMELRDNKSLPDPTPKYTFLDMQCAEDKTWENMGIMLGAAVILVVILIVAINHAK